MRGNACRICLNSDENELVELFGIVESESHAQKLNFCAGIEVQEDDHMPQKICYDCLQKVDIACEIKEKCIETDQLLRKHLKDEPEEHLEPDNCEVNIKVDPDWLVSYVGEASNYALPVLQKHDAYSRDEEPPRAFAQPSRQASSVDRKSFNKKPIKTPGSQADRRETRVEDYSCVFCDKVFKKIFEKKEHMKADHANELICKVCNRKRGSVLATERCIKDHQFGFSYLCQICARPFRRRCNLVDHIAEAHTDNPIYFSCDICGIKIRHKNSLKRHMRSVHMGEKFPCPFFEMCPTLFYSTKNSLNIHMYRHHNVPAPFYCDGCGDGFSNVAEVKVHQRKSCRGAARSNSTHGTPNGRRHPNISLSLFYDVIDGMFHCKLCPKIYSSKLKYSYHHTENHKDNKTCEICNKTFNQFTTFRRHMKVIHEKIKNFVCDHPGCGKTFARSHGLIIHKNTHTGEKPFACTLCSYRSGDTSSLFKHKKKMHP